MIVAIVAIHGVYNKQKIINAYAFKLPNPAAVSAAVKADIPSAELILLIPYKTEKLDTTTSFAEMPGDQGNRDLPASKTGRTQHRLQNMAEGRGKALRNVGNITFRTGI